MASDKKSRRLLELHGSGFEMADGQPDIRKWEVFDTNGHRLGKVHELVFDSRARKIRYLVLDGIESKELQLEKRRVMIPIGLAELDQKNDYVILHHITPFQLRALPRYDKDDLGLKAERDISTVFGHSFTSSGDTGTATDVEDEFYNHDNFNDQNLFRNRQQSGSTYPGTFQERRSPYPSDYDRQHDPSYMHKEEEMGTPASYPLPDEGDNANLNRERTLREEEELRRMRRRRDL